MELRKIIYGIGMTAIITVTTATFAKADVIILDFEGVGDLANVANFYNGGTDGLGNSGINYGISFSNGSLGLVDSDAGGSGNIANEPSGETVMFFQDANNAILNFASGFDTGFSFFYTTATDAMVTVYDGLDGSGNILGSLNLPENFFSSSCVGDPNGELCMWDAVGINFAGIAKSIDFSGGANTVAFDDITFGSANAGSRDVPEPAPLALLGLGLLGMGIMRKRQK